MERLAKWLVLPIHIARARLGRESVEFPLLWGWGVRFSLKDGVRKEGMISVCVAGGWGGETLALEMS